MRVLVAEDDAILADGVVRALRQQSYVVDVTGDGTGADRYLGQCRYDVVVLDLGLPGLDGLEVLRRARLRGDRQPILILTARDSIEERVVGLDAGADDYLVKPFALAELEARLRMLIRRGHGSPAPVLEFANLKLDLNGRRVHVDDRPLELSAREFGVFEVLALRAGRVVSKEQILDHLYEHGDAVYPSAVEVYVHRLRRKLGAARAEIRTVRGLGYMLDRPRAA